MSPSSEDRQFADLVVAQGICSREKVDECLSFIDRLVREGVNPVPRLGELLVRKGYLTPGQLDATLRPASARREADRAEPELPPEAAEAAADPAHRVGRYVRVALLGAGGMGEVWRAWDPDLRRWVALKFLKGGDPDEVARFQREAQTAAGLAHPNIASVYEVGESNGRPFLAMQYVQGQTLATYPRKDVRRLVDLVRDAALAVHTAHEQGVIHRDLKPHNLMVEGSRVFVMDFGLAKSTSVGASLSISGTILGTPAYMAPEQARGEAARVGPASDVYSLGATLYELLTGRPPFEESEVYALLRKVVEEEPAPVRRRNPRVDRDLETIVLKCLEKEPARRYATARALAEDLTRWLKGEAILAHPPSTFYKVRKFVGRRKAVTGLAAAAVLAIGILLPGWLRERSEKKALAELAELRSRTLVVKEWHRQKFRKPADIRAALETELAKLSDFVARHPRLLQGHYVRAMGRLMQGRLDEAEADLREAIRLDRTFAPAWTLLARVKLEEYGRKLGGNTVEERDAKRAAARPILLEAAAALADGWKDGGDRIAIERWGLSRTTEDTVSEKLAQALREFYVDHRLDDALATLRAAHDQTPSEEFCRWLGLLAHTRDEKSRWIDAALEIAPHWADPYWSRTSLRIEAKDYAGALADSTALLSIEPGNALAYVDRSLAWLGLKEYAKALDDCTRAVELHPREPLAYINRAAIRLKRREPDEAERDASEAIRLAPDHPLGYVNRAGARLERGDFEAALRDADRAIALYPGHPVAFSNRATARMFLNDFEGAAKDVERALALQPDLAEAFVTRAGLKLTRKDGDGALRDADRALQLDPEQAIAYSNRACALSLKGDVEAARADSTRAVELAPRSATVRSNDAFVRLRAGDVQGAYEAATRAIELDGRFVFAYVNRAAVELVRENLDRALADAARAVELGPASAQALLTRGLIRHEKGDREGAVEDCTKALQRDPNLLEAYFVRGCARLARGEKAAAVSDLEHALQKAPPGWLFRKDVEEQLRAARRSKDP